MAGPRYWRLFIIDSYSPSYAGLDELDLRESPAGPRLTTTGSCTASASSTQAGGYAAAGVLDGLTYTTSATPSRAWFSDNGFAANSWLKIDFGAGNGKDIHYCQLTNVSNSTDAVNYSIKRAVLQSSEDDTSYSDRIAIPAHPNTVGAAVGYVDLTSIVARRLTGGAAFGFSPAGPVGTYRLRDKLLRDLEHSGRGQILGTAKIKSDPVNIPVRRRCILLRMPSALPIRETWSALGTGAYAFTEISQAYKYTVLVEDYTRSYRMVVADNITPDAMP